MGGFGHAGRSSQITYNLGVLAPHGRILGALFTWRGGWDEFEMGLGWGFVA